MEEKQIEEYFLIGDLHTAALISNGAIEWLCLPHFDSPSVFARILDKKAGHFSVSDKDYTIEGSYLRDTAILNTEFRNKKGRFSVKDFMVPQPDQEMDNHILVRKFEGGRGRNKVSVIFDPRPDYARQKPNISRKGNELIVGIQQGNLKLICPEDSVIKKKQKGYEISFGLEKDEIKQFFLLHELKKLAIKHEYEKSTAKFWHNWVSKGEFIDSCRDSMVRSAITLKLMQFYPTGAIIAAPTTSLPEALGSVRNWDYRYVWIRDATFTLYGLYVLGYKEEAEKFFSFIEKIAEDAEDDEIDISLMYTIDGGEVPDEYHLDNFSGYMGSKPVRVGNEAADQFQLDVYGAMIDAYYFMAKKDLGITHGGKKIIKALMNKIKEKWMEKDSGIWEVRDKEQHFTYSKVMAWVGVNRAIRLCKELDISDKTKREWKKLEGEIEQWIWENCYDENKKRFLQHPETEHQDATNFLFVLLKFLDKHDEKTREILKNTAEELRYNHSFVYRYINKDGLEGKEGAFVLCSFWLISAFAIIEDIKYAEKLFAEFEKKIAPNGLISEEVDPETGKYLGNYPQAFSHLGYIMSAYYIDKYKKRKA